MNDDDQNKNLALSMLNHVRAVVLVLQQAIEGGFSISEKTLGEVTKLSVAARRIVEDDNLKNLFK